MAALQGDAELELREIAAWYDDRRQGLGRRFLDAVAAAAALLDQNAWIRAPWIAAGVPEGIRRFALKGFPYRLVY